jgi:hypothetical protein
MYIYTYIHAHAHTHTYIHIYKYIYIHIHTYTHTHTHKGPGSTGAPQGRVRANCEPRTRRRLQCVMGTLVHTSHGSLSSTRRPQTAGMMRRPCLRASKRNLLRPSLPSHNEMWSNPRPSCSVFCWGQLWYQWLCSSPGNICM